MPPLFAFQEEARGSACRGLRVKQWHRVRWMVLGPGPPRHHEPLVFLLPG